MLIVDAQIHMGAPTTEPWVTDPEARRAHHSFPDVTVMLAEMDRAGVDAVVLVPPLGNDAVPDNGFSLAAAHDHPDRIAVMGRYLAEDRANEPLLTDWMSQPGMLGIRLSFRKGRGNHAQLTDGTLDWFWEAAGEHGIPLMVNVGGLAESLVPVAQRHPKLRVIVDHLGLPSEDRIEDLSAAVAPLLQLADFENVAVKASALPCFIHEEYPFPTLYRTVKDVVNAFGANRTFWGSDLSRLPCDYGDLVRFFRDDLDFLTEEQHAAVLGEGILNWLQWDGPRARRLAEV